MALRERPLLPLMQGIIERTYRMPRVVPDAGAYLIGDRGLRLLYGEDPGEAFRTEGDRHLTGARVLVRSPENAVRLALYYPNSLVRHLERHDPRRGIDDTNIDAFAVLIEELDHLLVIATRAARRRPVTLFELELHAAVTKYLVVVHFLGRLMGRRRLSEFHRSWARHHLFAKYHDGGGGGGDRYREAARLAGRYVAWLGTLPVAARRAELIDFDRRGLAEQVGWIGRVA